MFTKTVQQLSTTEVWVGSLVQTNVNKSRKQSVSSCFFFFFKEVNVFCVLRLNADLSLFSLLSSTQGVYASEQAFLQDLKLMWFGLYSRYNGKMDSSGFEHIFAGSLWQNNSTWNSSQ